MSETGDDNIIRVSGTETQMHAIELPTGSVVVGMGVVYVRLDGDVCGLLRCAGRDKSDRQVYYTAMRLALDSFKQKHKLRGDDDDEVEVELVRQ